MHSTSWLSWQFSTSMDNFAFCFLCDNSFSIFGFVFDVKNLLRLSWCCLKGDSVTSAAFSECDVLALIGGVFS